MKTMDDFKKDFLDNEIFILAWSASVQRTSIYAENVSEIERRKFKESVREILESKILPNYKKEITETAHYENIECLQQKIQKQHSNILKNGEYRIGTAQKLLNLLLKYYWCLGTIPKPPHFPVDRICLSLAGIKDTNWTEIKTMEEYKTLIERIKESLKIGTTELAEWELKNWNRR